MSAEFAAPAPRVEPGHEEHAIRAQPAGAADQAGPPGRVGRRDVFQHTAQRVHEAGTVGCGQEPPSAVQRHVPQLRLAVRLPLLVGVGAVAREISWSRAHVVAEGRSPIDIAPDEWREAAEMVTRPGWLHRPVGGLAQANGVRHQVLPGGRIIARIPVRIQ